MKQSVTKIRLYIKFIFGVISAHAWVKCGLGLGPHYLARILPADSLHFTNAEYAQVNGFCGCHLL